MKYLDKRTNTIKTAYSIETTEKHVLIKFSKDGKTYSFNPNNIELLNEHHTTKPLKSSHKIYLLEHQCYKCKQNTIIFTYLIFDDGSDEDLTFPWDKERLLENQDLLSHMIDPSIEYYGLKLVGADKKLDDLLIKQFPGKIKRKHSKTMNCRYAMNLCSHCGAKQGYNSIYKHVNERISNMEPLEEFGEL